MNIFALVLFALMYVLMIVKPKYRPLYALSVAVIFLISGILPLNNLMSTINWNVLLMIAGTMIIVYYFIDSRMPNLLADILLGKSKNVMWVTILMSLFSGVISAFIDNVAKEGYSVSFAEFMRIGIPYTLVAVMTGYLYFWFIWA